MKLYKFLPLVFLLLVFLDNSEAICCDSGCSPSANVCCTPSGGGPSVGYVGCFDATTSQYVCPRTAIGECLECETVSCEPTSECSWVPQTSGICNGCEVTYDNDDYPIDSQCSAACGSGETKCADSTCQADCTQPPECLNTNDGCCLPDLDLICDPNCTTQQDPDCSGETPILSHSECSNQQCVEISGEGINLCNANSDCSGVPSTPSHKACGANGNCLDVSGEGTNTCSSDAQCTPPPPGILPSHSECSNQQCVEISGEGINLCNANSDCSGVPSTPNHKACGANGNCLTISGSGTDTCSTNSQCTPPPGTFPFHAECNTQQQCVQVSGEGTDLCTSNQNCASVPTTPSHKACGAGGDCLTISGFGTDTCTTNSQCLQLPPPGENPSYAMCSVALQCVEISGLGNDLCASNGNCAGLPTTPNHKTCSAGGNCISVIGAGANTCTTNSQCLQLPPPGGTTCTPSSGDCCLPINDGQCDSDCVFGVDPNCQSGSPLDDGICNADNEGICDINCFEGIDIPDCNGFAYTSSSNDGCLPLPDERCDFDCPSDTDIDCAFIPGPAVCQNNGVCEDFEGCNCDDCIVNPVNACVSGLFCCGNVCSGDLDNDLICDGLDYCMDTFTENDDPDNQLDTDNDCYVNSKKSGIFGFCGDQCEQVDTCFDVYGSRQCCDDLAGSSGSGAFHGFTEDCPAVGEASFGCWDSCISTDSNGNIITYKIGQCIDGSRAVTKLLNNIPIERSEEPCTSIPLIPFFTNFSIVSTFLILIIYYVRRKD